MRENAVSLHLDSDHIILRSIGDEEPEPAVLSGSVVLDLHERTHITDILLVFNGRAHICYTDNVTYKTYNFDLPIFHHDQSFLPSFHGSSSLPTSASSRPSSAAGLETRRDSHSGQHSSNTAADHSATFNHHPLQPSGLSTGQSSASSSGVNLAALNHSSGTSSAASHHHPAATASSGSSKPYHAHSSHSSHTLNAGIHRFPFSITIPGSLPASLKIAGLNASAISYQLKVTLQKSGVFGGKKSVKRPITIIRGLLPEAAEYNQTLEIDNTWPNKIMYNFTLPQKAFCAGETIPIALKFTPISKGVRVTQLVTNIKEHVTVLNKNSQPFNTTRDIVTKKHSFLPRSSLPSNAAGPSVPEPHNASSTNARAHPVSMPPSRSGSHTDLAGLHQPMNRLTLDDHPALSGTAGSSTSTSPGHGAAHWSHSGSPANATAGPSNGAAAPASGQSSTSHSRVGSRPGSPERIYYGRHTTDPDFVGLVDDDAGEEVDVDAVIEIPIPLHCSPSHSLEPILVSHKIKWSAFIKNLDGHTSELRCALPIHVLSPLLTEEARLASSGTRSLLFGASGVLVPAAEGIQQVDLPSYADHVRDRVATVESAGSQTNLAAAHTNTVQSNTSFVRSPWASPLTSPEHNTQTSDSHSPGSYFPTRPINWADSELLSTLALATPMDSQHPHHQSRGSSSHGSPATSRPGSRPGSRGGSRTNSRTPSRANSPTRGDTSREEEGIAMAGSANRDHEARPTSSRGSSSGFLSHLPKPLRPFTGLGGSSSSHSSSTNVHRASSLQPEERSMSTGSLSNFFSSHGHSRSFLGRQSHDQVHSDSASVLSSRNSPQDTTDGPRPGDLQAALEAAQAKQQDKGKKRAHFSADTLKGKGKRRSGAFSSMLHEDDDDDHDHHDTSDDHLAHQQLSNRHEHSHDDHADESPSAEDETGSRILSQVPSYQVASRGFLGGVIPLSASKGLPSYDESEQLSRPGSPLQRTETSATRSSVSTTGSASSREHRAESTQ